MAYVTEQVAARNLSERPCLEVGALDENGSARSLFIGPYLGLDQREGPGVDELGDAEALDQREGSFPVVVCTETLEHVERPWLAVAEMARVLEPGGHLILTARGYDERGSFPVHDFPRDLWRFSPAALRVLAEAADLEVLHVGPDPEQPGAFLTARK